MWKPPMLLEPAVERILRDNFPPEAVRLLGWKNGRANALNKNWECHRNPSSVVKAANTMLAKPTAAPLLATMLAKERASEAPGTDPVVPAELLAVIEEHHDKRPARAYDPEEEREDLNEEPFIVAGGRVSDFVDGAAQAELDRE